MLLPFLHTLLWLLQVCEQCANVKYEREGYFITVDIEKGMQDGQVSFRCSFPFASFRVYFSVNLFMSVDYLVPVFPCILSYVLLYVGVLNFNSF